MTIPTTLFDKHFLYLFCEYISHPSYNYTLYQVFTESMENRHKWGNYPPFQYLDFKDFTKNFHANINVIS